MFALVFALVFPASMASICCAATGATAEALNFHAVFRLPLAIE